MPRTRTQLPPAKPKRIAGYKLPVDVIRFIKDEATAADCWPAKIVEQMARERQARKRGAAV